MPIAFAAVDWWIVLAYMLVATVPGFLCRKYIRGQDDFLVAGRTLSVYLATATLTATEMGLVTVMYMAQEGFAKGLSALTLGLIALLTTFGVGVTGFMVAGLRRSGATTVAEYYQMRYGGNVRLLGGLIIATAGVLNYGVFLRVEAEFVRYITQMPDLQITALGTGGDPIVIPSIKLCMAVLVILVLTYTLLGGMVSVVLTDYVQFIVLSAGMAGATWWVLAYSGIGGFSGIVQAVQEHRPGYGLNPFVTDRAATGSVLGLGIVWILWQCMHWTGTNTWQTQAFRTAATDSPKTAKAMWMLTAVNYFGRAAVPMLWGVAALAYFSQRMSPSELGKMDSLQAMPMFLAHLPKGLIGFLLAGMLAALMSTHSSYLLAWSGVITEDLIAPLARLVGYEIPVHWRIRITRVFILLLACFLMWYGLWFKAPGTVWEYLSVTGTMYLAGAATLVAMGLYWKGANIRGAYMAILFGALPGLIYLGLRIGALRLEPGIREAGYIPVGAIARLSAQITEPYMGLISFPLAVVGMILGSLWATRAASKQAAAAVAEVPV